MPTLCRRVQQIIVTSLHAGAINSPKGSLTAREHQMIGCLFTGLRDKEIAENLGIAPGTVHIHLANVFHKLRVHKRGEALRRFMSF